MRLVAKGIIVAGPPCAMNIFLWLVALPLVTVLGTWENHVFANFPRASTVVWDNFSLHWWVRWWPCRCAMMRHDVPRSSSVHQRHVYGPEGNQQNAKVRMSNRLVKNFCVWLELLARHRKFLVRHRAANFILAVQDASHGVHHGSYGLCESDNVEPWVHWAHRFPSGLVWKLGGGYYCFWHEFLALLVNSKDGILFP